TLPPIVRAGTRSRVPPASRSLGPLPPPGTRRATRAGRGADRAGGGFGLVRESRPPPRRGEGRTRPRAEEAGALPGAQLLARLRPPACVPRPHTLDTALLSTWMPLPPCVRPPTARATENICVERASMSSTGRGQRGYSRK